MTMPQSIIHNGEEYTLTNKKFNEIEGDFKWVTRTDVFDHHKESGLYIRMIKEK